MVRTLACVALTGPVLGGCMATDVANIVEADHSAGNDESTIWRQADVISALLSSSEHLLVDEHLDSYLERIADRLLAVRRASLDERVRVRLLRAPSVNAFALPNGDIYLMTGLVSTLQREDQLAAVIGHEIGHVYDRHSLRASRNMRNKQRAGTVGVLTLGVAAAAAAGQAAGSLASLLAGSAGNVWSTAMITGYSREFEHRSDELSVTWLHEAGYDPHASAESFEIMLEQSKGTGEEEAYAWHSTHPKLRERVRRSREHAGSLAASGRPAEPNATFDALVAFATVENARAYTTAGAYAEALAELEKVHTGTARVRTDADAEFVRGEVSRYRDDAGDLDAAIAAYARAVAIDPTHAAGYRELGLLARSTDRSRVAQDALRRYTRLAPDALDRAIIESYIDDLEERQ